MRQSVSNIDASKTSRLRFFGSGAAFGRPQDVTSLCVERDADFLEDKS